MGVSWAHPALDLGARIKDSPEGSEKAIGPRIVSRLSEERSGQEEPALMRDAAFAKPPNFSALPLLTARGQCDEVFSRTTR